MKAKNEGAKQNDEKLPGKCDDLRGLFWSDQSNDEPPKYVSLSPYMLYITLVESSREQSIQQPLYGSRTKILYYAFFSNFSELSHFFEKNTFNLFKGQFDTCCEMRVL